MTRRNSGGFDYDHFRATEGAAKKSVPASLFDFFYPLVIGVVIVATMCKLGFIDSRIFSIDEFLFKLFHRY